MSKGRETFSVEFAGEGVAGPEDEMRTAPFGLVIFGASGDLTSRKLIPAIFELYSLGFLPKDFFILGTSRTKLEDEQFRERIRPADTARTEVDSQKWQQFASHMFYTPLDYSSEQDYRLLARQIQQLARKPGPKKIVLFHLAVPPGLHGLIAKGLASAGLANKKGAEFATRLVAEKPFGHDLQSARELHAEISQHFSEKEVFRIDHYLAKETVQNLLVFRLANSIFEPIWNRSFIERIDIRVTEEVGVGSRAGYYDKAGVLRDMLQNHLMQMLALCAMEPPAGLDSESVRDEKTKVYRQIRPIVGDVWNEIVLGQYGPGKVKGEQVPAYLQEQGVSKGSLTPTFATLRVFVDNWRWQGVPFYLVSGKRMQEKRTEISVKFRRPPMNMFGGHKPANQLVFTVHPTQGIELDLQVKQTGSQLDTKSVTMRLDYAQGQPSSGLTDYARVLLDALRGEHMLFWRQDGIELSWQFLEPIINMCEQCNDRQAHLHVYEAGSNGPELPIGFDDGR